MERKVEQTCQAGDAVARGLQAGQPRAVLQQMLQPKEVFKAEVDSYTPVSSSCIAVAVALRYPLCQGHPCARLNLPCKQEAVLHSA